jgi:mono/diheme cytochrome c family protein
LSPEINPQAREAAEPGEVPRGLPAAILVVIALVAAFGVGTFLTEVTEAGPGYGDGRTLSALRPAAPAPAAAEGAAPDGAAIYAARCVACHQASGGGLAGAFPPLAASEWVLGAPERPAAILLRGLNGAIDVRGATFNGAMPAFGAQLSDAEIAAVLSHVRASFGNSASAVDAALVAEVRAKTEAQTGPIAGEAALVGMFP